MERQEVYILFDGYCRLCNGTVRFLLKKDRKNIFQFVSIQSERGKQILKENQVTQSDSVVLIYDHSVYFSSDAFIEIVQLLSFPWNLLKVIKYLPKKWRDGIYEFIANNRYRWFDKQKSCALEL
jgi:predicted DCC family thiol-disulfide oxidoreductase YuxK